MRFMTACFALSLILPSVFLGLGSSSASAGISSDLSMQKNATPLIVEVKRYKGKSSGNVWNRHHRKAYSGRHGNRHYVKRWNRRPHYGSVVAGVALGTIIGVAAAGVAPPPRGNLCWYWSDLSKRSGYWDYCY
jgi:hypothetical protein